MELTLDGLLDTRQAFDRVASGYGRANAENAILCAMRERSLALITSHVRSGASLLDLGCGPGLDAVWFGERGYDVTAVDWSPAMAQRARDSVRQQGLTSTVTVHSIGIHELARLGDVRFDAAYSNFGPLNCVPDLAKIATDLASRVRPGGVFVASVIGRICPWEILRYAAVGDWRRVRTRFSTGFVPVPLENGTVWTRYYTPAAFERVFRIAGFRTLFLGGLGLFLPPPYLQGFHSRHPTLMRWLDRMERHAAHWPIVRQCGDHFLIAMANERRA